MRQLGDSPLEEILDTVMQARQIAEGRFSVWHAWAVTNYDQLQKASEANSAAAAAAAEEESKKQNDKNNKDKDKETDKDKDKDKESINSSIDPIKETSAGR